MFLLLLLGLARLLHSLELLFRPDVLRAGQFVDVEFAVQVVDLVLENARCPIIEAQAELAAVARVFNLAKQEVTGYDTYARQIARLFHARAATLESILDGLFHIAKADGTIHPAELNYLENVARLFGFGPHDFARIKARHVSAGADDPYIILDVDRKMDLATIKLRYRKLVRDNHPDKQIAAGVPAEMVVLATSRLARINAAYEQILKEHQL